MNQKQFYSKFVSAVSIASLISGQMIGFVPNAVAQTTAAPANLSNTVVASTLVVPPVFMTMQPGSDPMSTSALLGVLPPGSVSPSEGASYTQANMFMSQMGDPAAAFAACGVMPVGLSGAGSGSGANTVAGALLGTTTDRVNQLIKDRNKGSGSTKGSLTSCPSGTGPFSDADCADPGSTQLLDGAKANCDFSEKTCTDYSTTVDGVAILSSDYAAAKKQKDSFSKWLDSYASSCKGRGKADLEAAKKVLACQVGVLNKAAAAAAAMLSTTMKVNQAALGRMTTYYSAIEDQYDSINTLLNGTSNAVDPKGLLGLQTFLTNADAEWSKDQGTITTDVQAYTKAKTDFTQFPIKSRMKAFAMCMGSNTNANAAASTSNNSCIDDRGVYPSAAPTGPGVKSLGPLDYISCMAYHNALVKSNAIGGNSDDANADATAMGKVTSNIISNMGGMGAMTPGSSVLSMSMPSANFTTYAQVSAQIAALFAANPVYIQGSPNAAATSQLQANLMSNVNACWNAAGSTTAFDTEKTAVTNAWQSAQTAVTTDFKTMNTSLTDAYQKLSKYMNQTFTAPTACSTTINATTIGSVNATSQAPSAGSFSACFTKAHNNIMKLVNGSTPGAFSNQLIKSNDTADLPPFVANCTGGLKQCITNLQTYSDVNIQSTIKTMAPAMQKFAAGATAATKAQFSTMAGQLSNLQSMIAGEFGSLKNIGDVGALTVGATSEYPTSCTPPPPFVPTGGGAAPPFPAAPCINQPDNAAGALAGMVTGAGEGKGILIGPPNPAMAKGIQAAEDAIDSHDKDVQGKIASMQKDLIAFDKIATATTCDGNKISKDGVSSPTSCSSCGAQVTACNKALSPPPTVPPMTPGTYNADLGNISSAIAYMNTDKTHDNSANLDPITDAIKHIGINLSGTVDCKTLNQVCNNCVSTKTEIFKDVQDNRSSTDKGI